MPERIDFRDQIARNKIKSFLLMFIIFSVTVGLIYIIGKAWGGADIFVIFIFAIIFSLSYLLITYYNSDKIAIASVGAKEADKTRNKQYYDVVESLTIASGLPMPKLYIMPSPQINAFASGRDPKHAIVCVTQGSLDKLEKKELEGVLAHEMSHVANYDTRYITFAAVMVGIISIISEIFLRSLWFKSSNRNDDKGSAIFMIIGIVLAIIAPIIVYFVQLAISRKREYTADASAVKFTRYPSGLISALKKIKEENQPEKRVPKAVAPLFFANPFRNLAATHPPIEKRISVLERM